tara:strand:+ start:1437 stop:3290 length:1854 start_codon:yes stop_codon:yes gene_type:complete
MNTKFDVIIIGAGHAGTEAAFAAATLGSRVLLLCTNLNCIAMMPCNPSVGGPGKGHLVREIHALGGKIASFVDDTYLQIRELNESRGPAVRALRAQADKHLYHIHVKQQIERHPNIELIQGEVTQLLHENSVITGVKIITGLKFYAPCVVLATGTFLNGKIIVGDSKVPGGPSNEAPALELTNSLYELGIKVHRLQTATPPRIAGSSIDFDGLKELSGHLHMKTFTGRSSKPEQRSCFLTYTNSETIRLIKTNIKKSPLKIGNITPNGPKHCPSIDRKVLNFPDTDVHQIFLEPESNYHDEWYLQGVTTSLPAEIQEKIVHSIKGLQNAKIMRYGYAIEYDAVKATQLKKTCEHKHVSGLFTCGQINGTSGYEEAAAQGLIAGVNAHLKSHNKKPFVLPVTSSYIAAMIDELVTNDRHEPLRVTTSSSEFRLVLRSDNAEERLTPIGYKLGLVSRERYQSVIKATEEVTKEIDNLSAHIIKPNKQNLTILQKLGSSHINKPISMAQLLARSEIEYAHTANFGYSSEFDTKHHLALEIRLKYSIFIDKLQRRINHVNELDSMILTDNCHFSNVTGLSSDVKDQLINLSPYSIGQISRIRGFKTSDLAILIHHYKQGVL